MPPRPERIPTTKFEVASPAAPAVRTQEGGHAKLDLKAMGIATTKTAGRLSEFVGVPPAPTAPVVEVGNITIDKPTPTGDAPFATFSAVEYKPQQPDKTAYNIDSQISSPSTRARRMRQASPQKESDPYTE